MNTELLIPFDLKLYQTGEYDIYTRNGEHKIDAISVHPNYEDSDECTYAISAMSATCVFTQDEDDISRHHKSFSDTFTINGEQMRGTSSPFDLMLYKKVKKVEPKLTFSENFKPGFMNIYLKTDIHGEVTLAGSKYHATYESAKEGRRRLPDDAKHLTTIQLHKYPDIIALLVQEGLIQES